MPRYPLNALGAEELERLVQSLLKRVIGNGTITFGSGADGAREATFDGAAPYPSPEERWSGHWIFQVKYHDVERIGGDAARKQLLEDVRGELARVKELYGTQCSNYILATNVPLSSQADVGTHDRVAKIAAEYANTIEHVHVWGYDELCRLVDADAPVRAAFRHLLTTGDMIARLLSAQNLLPLDETIQMYLQGELRNERNAQLDQAGDVGSEAVALERIFTDLDVLPRRAEAVFWSNQGYFEDDVARSAMELLLGRCPRVVLIGGPGQGKSTLGQFLGQVHRATLLGRLDELGKADIELEPVVPRIPFRVVLREMAQWMARRGEDQSASVEQYVATRVEKAAAGCAVSPADILEILRGNPCLFVFDGLDEVVDIGQRRTVLQEVEAFVERVESVLRADVQIVGSSRPNSYSNEFHPKRFMHLELQPMDRPRVDRYVEKWLATRNLDDARAARVLETFAESAADPQLELLLTTPLQVSIVIYVILSGGRPSRQRESLFNDYVDVIYRRERAKHRSIIETEKDILIGLHQYLGYLLHRRAGDGSNVESTLSAEEFETEVRRYLTHMNPYADGATLEHELRTLVAEARERLVLLVENSDQHFGFELRSLQEYFAASHLVETSTSTEERYRRFATIATSSHWRNTALFFAGRVGRAFRGEAPHLIEVCRGIDRRAPDTLIRRGAMLARALAVDRAFGSNAGLQRSAIEESLTQLESDPYVWRASGAAAELGRLTRSDQSSHLLPALVAKLNALDLVRARLAVSTIAGECGFDAAPLAEVLRQRSGEGSMRDRALTIATLLRIDRSAESVACARAFATEADPESFAAAFRLACYSSVADQLMTGLALSRQHWRELVADSVAAPLMPDDVRQLDVPVGEDLDRPLDGWEAARLVLQLVWRVAASSHVGRPRPAVQGVAEAEQVRLADPRLDAARSLVLAAIRLFEWRLPSDPLAAIWEHGRAVDSAFPRLMGHCLTMFMVYGSEVPAWALLCALRDRNEAHFTAAAEMVGRFYDGESSAERFRVAHRSLARSIRSDADYAAFGFGIPGRLSDDRTEARFGVSLARYGEILGRGPGATTLRDQTVARILELAEDATGPSWPGLPAARLRSLLRSRDWHGADEVETALYRYLDRLSERSPDARLAGESAAVAVVFLLPDGPEDPRLWRLLPRISAPPRVAALVGASGGPNVRRAIGRLVAHVQSAAPDDPAAVRGAAAVIVWLTERELRKGASLELTKPPRRAHVVAFLRSKDELVRRAGMRLLRTMSADAGNRLLLAELDRLLEADVPPLSIGEVRLAAPQDPGLRAEVVAALSEAVNRGPQAPGVRAALLNHLIRVAAAQQADVVAHEAELSLPLAASASVQSPSYPGAPPR